MILGVDVGGSFTRLGVVDKNLNVTHFTKVKTADIVENFSAFIETSITTMPPLKGIVMGFPGVVNPKSQTLIKMPNQPQLSSLDTRALSARIHLPILIDKDTHLLFHFDRHQKRLDQTPNILGFYLGTGLGNVIYLNHAIIRGDFYGAGELGHLKMRNESTLCPCGYEGCFETKVSGHYLQAFHAKQFLTPYDTLFIDYLEHPKVAEFIDEFVAAMMIEIHLLDVQHIIIGGGVVQMKGFPQALVIQKLNDALRNPALTPLSIHFTENIPDNGVIGAAIWGYQTWET